MDTPYLTGMGKLAGKPYICPLKYEYDFILFDFHVVGYIITF